MEIHLFNDPNQIPQPKDKIRIESLVATPYPDRFRVHVDMQVTMFQERPNLLLVARHESGKIVAELDIIATMHAHMEFTLHIRGLSDPTGNYTLDAELFYETRQPPQARHAITFSVPPAE
jgi:hypothetical protein